ncbi:MAG TPA: CAP domain-containing protein [Patescibacteria group bacterium]|nr:CAP domain-containing protein [Patescibacteria group bacterium]
MNRKKILLRAVGLVIFVLFDLFLLQRFSKNFVSLKQSLQKLQTEISTVPEVGKMELSDLKWVNTTLYGKITNHNVIPIEFVSLKVDRSNTKDPFTISKTEQILIPKTIPAGGIVYFAQSLAPASKTFWWQATVDSALSATDSSKLPKGLRLSASPIAIPKVTSQPADTTPWGVAQQINADTWRIRVGEDSRMGTPQEILQALNTYRNTHGKGSLSWDDKLATFAGSRAAYLNSIKGTDNHKGFIDYTSNEDNVRALGFGSLGENLSYGYQLLGVHLIEWIFASDSAHDANQLNSQWTHVGIATNGLAVDLIFGGSKL